MNAENLNHETLLACCGSQEWVRRMAVALSARVHDAEGLHELAEGIWWSLTPEDWLEAFAAHPQIGEQSSKKWSAQEQAGMSAASRETADSMALLNAVYRERFGYIFIVCATGKSGEQMRQLLEQRMAHSPEQELRVAAAEQAKIMHLRLDKVLAG